MHDVLLTFPVTFKRIDGQWRIDAMAFVFPPPQKQRGRRNARWRFGVLIS